MVQKFKVYVSDYDYPDIDIEKSVLESIGATVIGLQCKTGEGLAQQAADADAILQQYAKIPRQTIEQLKQCKVICRYGIGVDIVDVAAAYEHGMMVTNVPDYCLDEVADHALSMGLMLCRDIVGYHREVVKGGWHWNLVPHLPKRLRATTWGFVGFGRIAQNAARKIQAFGATTIAYDPYVSDSFMRTQNTRKADFDTLLETSDVVCILAPHTPETEKIMNEAAFRRMKNDAIFLCASRGKTVDNAALYRALHEGQIAAAALDDVYEEPAKLANWNPKDNPLFGLDNCYVTPHVAYVSKEALLECRRIAAENARDVLLGKRPPNIVLPPK